MRGMRSGCGILWAGVLGLTPGVASAQTWDGGGANNNWTTAGNWNPDAAPANNGTAAIVFGGATRLAPLVNTAQDVLSITFNNTAGAFVVGGALGLTIRSGGVVNNDDNLQTITANLSLAASQTWNAATGPLQFSGALVDFAAPATLFVDGSAATTIGAAMTGSGNLTKNGSGTLTLTGANAFDGTLAINAGIVSLGGGNERLADDVDVAVAGGAALRLNGQTETIGLLSGGGAVELGGGTLLVGSGGGDSTYSGVISNAGDVRKLGAGTLTISGPNTFGGATTVFDGTLRLAGGERLANSSALVVSGGTLDAAGFTETVAEVTLSDGALVGTGTLVAGSYQLLAGEAALRLGGTATVTKSGAGVVLMSAAHTYIGPTFVLGGTLRLEGANERLPNVTDLIIDGGTFALAGRTETVEIVQLTSGAIEGPGTLNSGSITVESGTVTANLSGNVGLQKVGSGVVEIGAACGYSGPTAIVNGALRLAAPNVLPDGTSATLSAGSTLDLNGHNEAIDGLIGPAGSIVGLGTGVLTVGGTGSADFTYAGAIQGAGGVTKTGVRTFLLNGPASFTGVTTVAGGVIRLGAADRLADASDLTVATGTFDLQSFNETIDVLQLAGGTISGAGTLTAATLDLRSGTIAARLTGPAVAAKSTPGLVTLSGANAYAGGTVVSGGTLAVASDGNLGAANATVTLDGGALRLVGSIDTARPTVITALGGTIETLAPAVVRGLQSGGGVLTKSGADVLVIDAGPLSLGGLSVSAGELVITGATLPLVSGSVTVAAPATLTFDGVPASAASVTNSGLIELREGARLGGPLSNGGLLIGDGTLAGSVNNLAAGELSVLAGAQLVMSGAANTNAGMISLLGGSVQVTLPLANQAGGLIAGDGVLRVDGGLTNSGSVAFSGDTDVLGDVSNAAGGRLITTGGAVTTFFDDVTHNGTDIRTAAGSATVFFGALSGPGPLTGTGTVYVEGDLRPGNSPAQVTVGGDLVLGPAATLEVEIAGSIPGMQHDQLVVAGEAVLDGTLRVVLPGGHIPAEGAVFTLITCGARTGSFAQMELPIVPGRSLSVETTGTAVQLRVSGDLLRGDTNCDGGIDFFDIDPFLLALFNPTGYAAQFLQCSLSSADVDADGGVNFFDIDPFLVLLFAP